MSARHGKLGGVKPRTGHAHPARPQPTGAQSIQRLAQGRARTGSKVQQRFARLIKQVDQRKQRLRAWYDTQPAIQRELAAYHALLEGNHRIAHDLVILFDRTYTHPTFTKAERKRLRDVICEMAGDLLGQQGFADLKPIYNRHSRSDQGLVGVQLCVLTLP